MMYISYSTLLRVGPDTAANNSVEDKLFAQMSKNVGHIHWMREWDTRHQHTWLVQGVSIHIVDKVDMLLIRKSLKL